jgi:protein Tex
MILEGTVRNIMDFGMFVDINVHCDGLVHISEVANKYVKNISDLYTINDVVKVKVISVDINKKRIGLSIKQVTTK